MLSRLKNFCHILFATPANLYLFFKRHKLGSLAFILAFSLTVCVIVVTAARSRQIKVVKQEIAQTIAYLEEFGLDISYENLIFNTNFTRPLLQADNFQIYSRHAETPWSFHTTRLKVLSSFWDARRLTINFGPEQTLTLNKTLYQFSSPHFAIQLGFNQEDALNLILAQINGLEIKDFAKVNKLSIAGRRLHSSAEAGAHLPGFENHIELKDVTLNGLLNYPLTSHIDRVYTKINFIGTFNAEDSLKLSLEDWLHRGGHIEIPSLVVNWKPLALVGRGELYFNERLHPRLHMNTSSKAMINLLDDLQNKGFLDRKGVFVSKILLNNKAFKLRETDQYLTIVTPIDYRDGQLSVEKITVRDFNRDKLPK